MKKIFLIVLLFSIYSFAQEVLDKIVAVVDNEFILKSELDFQTNMVAAQRKLDPNSAELRKQVLNSIIEEKLIYAQANFDSIMVTDEEVTNRINYQLEVFKQQYGSIERVEQMYGMSVEKIKRELRDEVQKSLMIQKLQEKNFSGIEASRREVEIFFNTYKDSLGIIPEKVTISHIYKNPKASKTNKEKYYSLAKSILDSIKNGANFSDMAKKYSEDPGSAAQGGDLGFVKRGVFYPEFEAAAFTLEANQISDVVESPVGYHIIQMLERRGESIKTRHILIKIKLDEQSDLNTITFLTEIRDSIVRKFGSFADYAKKYSEDNDTAPFGGDLGTFFINQLDKQLLDAVSKLKEGEIGFPRRIEYSEGNYGYHIVYLVKRTAQHLANLDLDYPEMKKLADDNKKQKKYAEWIEQLKSKIYWDVRI
ncbi:MAG: peptidylprolyl isomerase [Ignavibacteriaceae bacterium]|nr:peptidylprolyl isomerase [Ignavibacteriaceae bacterium]